MDPRGPAEEVHAVSGAVPRPERHHLWPRILLDLCPGLGQGEGRVSAVQAGCAAAEDLAAAVDVSVVERTIANEWLLCYPK